MTPALMCAAAFMLSSFLLNFFSLGDAGLIIGYVGVIDPANSPLTASLFFTNSAYNLWAFGFPAFGPIEQTSSDPFLSSSASLCLLLK